MCLEWTNGVEIKDYWQDYDNNAWHGTVHGTPTGIAEIPFIRRGDSANVVVEGHKPGKLQKPMLRSWADT